MPSSDDTTKAYDYYAVIPNRPIALTSLTEKAGVVQVNSFRFVFQVQAEQRRKLVKLVAV